MYPPKRQKTSGPREWYVNWAGLFAHPTEDIDMFVRLPKWRQREILATQAAFKKDPTLQASKIHNIVLGKSYPGQNVFEPSEDTYKVIQGPPNSIKYNVPDGISLRVVKKFGSTGLRDAVDAHERKELGYLF